MWKNIKKKWEHLFDEESESKETIKPPNRSQHKSLETKIAYQYPKTNKVDTIIKRKPVYQEEQVNEPEEPVEKQTIETNREPFKARDIPSPVHGFRKRSIPKVEEKSNRVEDRDKHVSLDNVTVKRKPKQKQEQLPTTTPQVKEEEPKQEEDIMTGQLPPDMDEKSPSSTKVEVSKVVSERKQVKQERTGKTKPLNVMMTPRDKWKQFKKQSAQVEKGQHVVNEKRNYVENEKDEPKTLNKVEQPKQPQRSVPIHLLNDVVQTEHNHEDWINEQAEKLQTTLRYFNIKAKVVDKTQGPSVTRFEIQPEPGVKVSKIKNLSDDIKLNLAAKDVRIEAPIPGKNTIGIEVPNLDSEPVFLQQTLESSSFQDNESPLSVALGSDIEGESVVTDLKKMPHGLIAGATGSGKSVCINTILISLLYKANYDEVKFLLIDPKMVELTPYNDIPHLVSPVITDVKAATAALKWAVQEMEDRYAKFVKEGARDINRYNEKMNKQNRQDDHMPYIVIVIDELADLMMTSPQDVEDAICRIAQKARACGIHLLIATQRPSVDVITGLIKANIPTRIAFSVSSQVDSRTILDTNGAEKLLGKGDMLFVENGSGETKRIQGAFVSDDEIERITNYVKQTASPNYLFEQEQLIQQVTSSEEADELYQEAVDFVFDYNGASASLLQRRFKIGYNRAARLIDMMEDNGIISGQNGSKQREVLASKQDIISKG
ncbi:DNA translocase FtsK [Gracilibacillus sp. S3-1-1]|uniref:DNA translocase FtsK n=1 Tax=Gracilibacillus pellucidus TaxID=3095368 RepID=A0ACC6M9F6_9BACI|nr:DNA translocase FtsK [Gracilibacillus sp. S3-1-1]MDX8047482.1 DNA translocase FtsK [Gracilibacillus sp. S3-1-1]